MDLSGEWVGASGPTRGRATGDAGFVSSISSLAFPIPPLPPLIQGGLQVAGVCRFLPLLKTVEMASHRFVASKPAALGGYYGATDADVESSTAVPEVANH